MQADCNNKKVWNLHLAMYNVQTVKCTFILCKIKVMVVTQVQYLMAVQLTFPGERHRWPDIYIINLIDTQIVKNISIAALLWQLLLLM